MLCQSLLYSKVTQFYTYIHSLFNILFHYGLSQEIGYSSLCYGCASFFLVSAFSPITLLLVL